MSSLDSFKARRKLTVGNKTYTYFSLKADRKSTRLNSSHT